MTRKLTLALALTALVALALLAPVLASVVQRVVGG